MYSSRYIIDQQLSNDRLLINFIHDYKIEKPQSKNSNIKIPDNCKYKTDR